LNPFSTVMQAVAQPVAVQQEQAPVQAPGQRMARRYRL
jgi:hypothetical protein